MHYLVAAQKIQMQHACPLLIEITSVGLYADEENALAS